MNYVQYKNSNRKTNANVFFQGKKKNDVVMTNDFQPFKKEKKRKNSRVH